MLTVVMNTTDTDTPTRLAGLLISGSAGVARGANTPQVGGGGWMVLKSDGSSIINTGGAPVATETTGDAGTGDSVTVTKAEFDALVAKAEQADAAEKAKDPKEEDLPAFMKKAMDELPAPVRKHFEDLAAQATAATKSAEEATAVAKAERDARLTGEYVAKAAEFSHLPTDAGTLGPVLRSIDELLPSAHAAEVLRLLKASNESEAMSALTKSFGTPTAGAPGSAWDRISKAADALVANSPELTHAQAVDRVLTTQTELTAAYVAERG